MVYQGVVFDLDGTLLDTLTDLANCTNAVLLRYGLTIHANEDYKIFVGNGMETLIRRVLPPDADDNLVKECLENLYQEYEKRWDETTRPYPGVLELLAELHNQGKRLSVLSNKADWFTKAMVQHYFEGGKFEFVYGARGGVPKKPHPAAALEIAALSQLQPDEFLYVGDSGVDMQTASAAGMYAVGVAWGFRKKEELLQYGAKTIINHPSELLSLL